MYIEFSPPDFPAVVNTSEGIRCTHLYTSSPTWTTVVSPTKRFSWTFSAVLVKSTCPMRKCGFTEEPNSLCCMFLCMSASCMTLFELFSLYPIFCFFFSLSQHDNQLWGCCHVKLKKKKFMKYKHIRSINPFKCNQKYNLFSLHSLNFGFNCFPSNCSMVFYIFFIGLS